jgi:hypothetical protein
VIAQISGVQLPSPVFEIALGDPRCGILFERHLSRVRVDPLTAADICLYLDEPILSGSLGPIWRAG